MFLNRSFGLRGSFLWIFLFGGRVTQASASKVVSCHLTEDCWIVEWGGVGWGVGGGGVWQETRLWKTTCILNLSFTICYSHEKPTCIRESQNVLTYCQTLLGCMFSNYRVHMEAQTVSHIHQSAAKSEWILEWHLSPFAPHCQCREHEQPHTEQLLPDCSLSMTGTKNHLETKCLLQIYIQAIKATKT